MSFAPATTEKSLTVSQLTALLHRTLEKYLPRLNFTGEISELTRARSGHLYFTVRDEDCQVSCVMWRGMAGALNFDPIPGTSVVCMGKPAVYVKAGRLQIIVSRMVAAGDGALQQKFLALKARLEKEGLFSEERKRGIPFLPNAVGIVTSASGAAIHDIMTRLHARMPTQKVYLFDARVQGPGSAEQIVRGIEVLNEKSEVEVIIVSRGGGSLEDLWCFNEEAVARAIFASRKPVISAVGHEVDITLSDLAADVRAPTPTAAGEMVVPDRGDLLEKIDALEDRLGDLEGWFYPLQQQFDDFTHRLDLRLEHILEHSRSRMQTAAALLEQLRPERLIALRKSEVQFMHSSFIQAVERFLRLQAEGVVRLEQRLDGALPRDLIGVATQKTLQLQSRLETGVRTAVREQASKLNSLTTRLRAASPSSVLNRGYALVKREGRFIRTAEELERGEDIEITFGNGAVSAEVTEKLSTPAVRQKKRRGDGKAVNAERAVGK